MEPMVSRERERFDFVANRDGREVALRFMQDNVIAPYRRAVLDPHRYTMYRRQLIESYCEAKHVLREEMG